MTILILAICHQIRWAVTMDSYVLHSGTNLYIKNQWCSYIADYPLGILKVIKWFTW